MAILENNIVTNIIVCEDNEPESFNRVTYTEQNPAYIGGDYFEGYFYLPQLFPSWSRDGKGGWMPPVPYPNDGNFYDWDEENKKWNLIDSPMPVTNTDLSASMSYFDLSALIMHPDLSALMLYPDLSAKEIN